MIEPLLPYDLPPPVKSQLLALAAQSDLLLLGETHGTMEVPRLVLSLLDDLTALGYGGLGLELPRGQSELLASWAAGAGEPPPFFGPTDFRDGRGSTQALSLIRQTLSHSGNWNLLCFDIDFLREGEEWADRDRHMAVRLLEQWGERCPEQKVVAVCGNYHSRLVAPAKPDRGPWPSFGYNVQQSRPDLTVNSVNTIFHGGSFFNGEPQSFPPREMPLMGDAEIRPAGRMGHTIELHLSYATPVTFFQEPVMLDVPAADKDEVKKDGR